MTVQADSLPWVIKPITHMIKPACRQRLGWANLINCFSSPLSSHFTPPPQISLLLLSIMRALILLLRRLAIILQHSKVSSTSEARIKHPE